MSYLLFAAFFLVSIAAHAEIKPHIHKLCLEAKDYAGCVKSMTVEPKSEDDSLTPLRNAMKQVAARLRSGTSLVDSTDTFRPVVDQLAIVEASHPDALAVQKAKLASRMFDALQQAWSTRIKATHYGLSRYSGMPMYDCEALKSSVDYYNSIAGAPYVNWNYTKGAFGWTACRVPGGDLPELSIARNVVIVLDEGSVSPAEIEAAEKAAKARKAEAERERELCAKGPWDKHLAENPSMKEWAKANPLAADAARRKFLADPKNQGGCSPQKIYGSDMNYDFLSR